MPLLAVILGAPINWIIVRGDYEWFGLLWILADVAARRGFWLLCLLVWLVGLCHAPAGYSIFHGARDKYGVWALATLGFLALLRLRSEYLRFGSVADELACAVVVPGLALHMVHTPGDWHERRVRALETLRTACLTFIGCTLVVYGYTMFKGMLFTVCVPVDSLLMKVDTSLLGDDFYERLASWRSVAHPQITRQLDIVYTKLFEQQWWSFLFFFGARDYLSGRRYILAIFLAYVVGSACYFIAPSLGPIYFRPDLFADCVKLAPDSARLVRLLAYNTGLTQAGVSHTIGPFGYIAAFPSLHVGIALIVALAMRRSPTMTLLNGFAVVLTFIATIVLGWHYAIDGIFGAVLGASCWWFAVRLTPYDEKGDVSGFVH